MERKVVSRRVKTNNILILILLVWFVAATGISVFTQTNQNLAPRIMTSIFPLREFAQAVCGDWSSVGLLLPPGAEIHTWRPRPSDLVKISSADMFIYIGADLEPWVDDILRSVKNPRLHVMEASEGLTLLSDEEEGEHEHSALDPHIWLDFTNDILIIDRITEILCEIAPDKRDIFRNNASVYIQKLKALDEKYRQTLDRCDQKTIVLGGHAAFGYLARRYGLSQMSLYGLSPDSKPTPRQLIDVVNFVDEKGIGAIFFEVNVSSELARVIAKETGAKTLVLNPGANLPGRGNHTDVTFLNIMEKNLENLKNGLGCR